MVQSFLPGVLADEPGYSGLVLMAKAQRWYEQYYGSQLKVVPGVGSIPVRLGNALWRMRTIRIYGHVELFASRDLCGRWGGACTGSVNASHNVLRSIDDLPQGLVDRLNDLELSQLLAFFVFARHVIELVSRCAGANKLFPVAHGDFSQCTEDVIARRYPQACAAAQLAGREGSQRVLGLW